MKKALNKFHIYTEPRKKPVDWVTSADFFKGFRFKKQRITKNENNVQIVHSPYIRNKDSSTHEFALTFIEWSSIIETYWDCVVDTLIEGNQFELHKNLGHIQLVKLNDNRIRGDRLFRNNHTLGYAPFVIWNRYRTSKFLHRMWYIFNISRVKQWNRVSKALMKDPSLIFRYPDGKSKRDM